MNPSFLSIVALSATLVAAFVAGGAVAEPYRVAFVPKGATHMFWKEMARGAEEEANRLKIDMVWRGPTNEEGVDAQNRIMGIYTRSKYDGIIVAPNSQTRLAPAIAEAVAAGTRIVVVDSPLAPGEPFPYVGTDNEKAGELAARQVAKDFPQLKKIMVYRYSEAHGSTSDREKGFLTAIRKLLPRARILDTLYSGVTVEEAETRLKDYLGRETDIELIFTPNESGTEGTIRALATLGLAGKVRHYGFDFSRPINEALRSGGLNGVVIQDPYLMGQKAMQIMRDAIEKKPLQKVYETPALMVTRQTIATKAVKSRIDPFLTLYPR